MATDDTHSHIQNTSQRSLLAFTLPVHSSQSATTSQQILTPTTTSTESESSFSIPSLTNSVDLLLNMSKSNASNRGERRRRRERIHQEDGIDPSSVLHTEETSRRPKRQRSSSSSNELDDITLESLQDSTLSSLSPPTSGSSTPRLSIPYRSTWFRLESIDKIEKRSLPDFFTRKAHFKTEQIYKEYRDWMISTYRLNPDRYLSGTVARKALCGDAGSILRIHSFLEFWGLINHNVPAHVHSHYPQSSSNETDIILPPPNPSIPFPPIIDDIPHDTSHDKKSHKSESRNKNHKKHKTEKSHKHDISIPMMPSDQEPVITPRTTRRSANKLSS